MKKTKRTAFVFPFVSARQFRRKEKLLYQFEIIFSLDWREQADFVNLANLTPRFSSTRADFHEVASRDEYNKYYERYPFFEGNIIVFAQSI